MKIPVSEAKARLADLIRRAEVGEDVLLTRRGQAAECLVPVKDVGTRKSRRALVDAIRAEASEKATPGPRASCSQDFLYGCDGFRG